MRPYFNGAIARPSFFSYAFADMCVVRSAIETWRRMMLERCERVDHTTIYRWVQRDAGELEKRC
jgi:hypothetical protein